MNKSILIHYNNTPNNLNNQFHTDNIIDFDYSNRDETIKSIDEYISKVIIESLKNKEFDIVYIKDNLSLNYLELYGIKVAYHIRLSQELGKNRFVTIIILSDLDGYSLNKLVATSNIIFTKNIFLEANSLKTFEKYDNKEFSRFDEKNYKKNFLDLIEVAPPENSNNHSIANEWAIFKWAKELNISNSDDINNTISNISYQLYFKYLLQKNEVKEEIKEIEEKHVTKHSQKGLRLVKTKEGKEKKILLIDDELDKGWGDIFTKYFKTKRGYTPPEILPIEFKNKSYEDIEPIILNYIEKNEPDVILLDMRLVDEDHKEGDPLNISGIKLLNKIKSTSLITNINPGIQVIMLSATTRSDILEQASKDNKILGYIQKDHIENNSTTTRENIKKLTQFLSYSEGKFYLKEIWDIQNTILQLPFLTKNKFTPIPEIKNLLETIFEILNSNISKPFIYIMFNIFKCIEHINGYYIEEENKIAYWKNDNSKDEIKSFFKKGDLENNIPHIRKGKDANNSAENKIRMIMHEKLKIKDYQENMQIRKLVCNRNYHMHTENIKSHCMKYIETEIKEENIIEWFKLLMLILNKINEIELK